MVVGFITIRLFYTSEGDASSSITGPIDDSGAKPEPDSATPSCPSGGGELSSWLVSSLELGDTLLSLAAA